MGIMEKHTSYNRNTNFMDTKQPFTYKIEGFHWVIYYKAVYEPRKKQVAILHAFHFSEETVQQLVKNLNESETNHLQGSR